MAWGDKETKATLVDVETGEYLEFQDNPSEISEEKSTAYAAIKIPGISHPRYQFVAGEPRTIRLKIQFFKGPVQKNVDWLRSLLYPEHTGSMMKNAPHRVLLVFGDLYSELVCIVKQVKVRYHKIFDRASLEPQVADVELVLEEVVDGSASMQEVR